MDKIKKGNRGNKYLEKILCKLGEEYSSLDEDIITNATHEFKVHHNNCDKDFFISWKKVYENSKCPYCFSRGNKISEEHFRKTVNEKYNNEFIFKKYEVRNNHKFFYLEHSSCNTEFWISSLFFNKQKPMCPNCSHLNTKTFKELVFKKYGNEYTVLGEYISLNSPVKIRHNLCGSIITTLRPNNLLNMNQGCKKCKMKKIADGMKNKASSKFYKELNEKFGDRFELYGNYNGYWNKINGYDNLLDKVFYKKPSDILKMSTKPTKSKGEIKIHEWLIKNNILFEEQYEFEDLKDKRKLKFDFYIPIINTLIEFDGEQHFIQRRDDLDGSKLKITQNHDKMKNEYCKNNNIPLLRISYKEFKSVEKILTEKILSIIPTQGS